MTALTQGKGTPQRAGDVFRGPVAAAVTCYEGGIAVYDGDGNLKPGVTGTGLIAVGIFRARADNALGAAAAINADYESGTFRFENSAAADAITKAQIGDACYIVDDQTVAKTSGTNTRSVAGLIADVDADGVWVRVGYDTYISPSGSLLAANNLSDLGSGATARANLGGGANKIVLALGPLSTKGADAAVLRFVAPVAGTVDSIKSVLNAALAGGDATLTAAINGTPITTGVLTLTQAGSAAGDVDTCSPSAAKTVAAGGVITITGGGSSTATATASVSILITPTA